MVPTQEQIGRRYLDALHQLSARVPGGLEALYPEFASPADEDEEGEEPWA